jgi:hypothetical protein
MSPVEFSPQSASVADIEQFGAVRANDTDVKLGAPTISAKAATLDNRIVDFLIFMRDPHRPKFTRVTRLELRLGRFFFNLGTGLLVVESSQLMQINVQVLQ